MLSLSQLKCFSTVVQITQSDRVLAWEALSATVRFYSATCSAYSVVHDLFNYLTGSMLYRGCHHKLSYNQPFDVNWTVTVIIRFRLPPKLLMTSRIPPPRTTVADGYKFSAVRRLSRRILDRSKNAIFTYPAGFGPFLTNGRDFRPVRMKKGDKLDVA